MGMLLGERQMMLGWERALVTMRRGELSRFSLPRDLLEGEGGATVPGVPNQRGAKKDATLLDPVLYELELLGYVSRRDYFGDGGVIRCGKRWGTGITKPKQGDEVRVALKAWHSVPPSSTLADPRSVDYVIGSGTLGQPLGQIVDKVVRGLTKGGAVIVECAPAYSRRLYSRELEEGLGAKLEVVLEELYEVEDVSWAKDGTVQKKRLKEGEDCMMPEEGDEVELLVEAATEGDKQLSEWLGSKKFVWGNGDVPEYFEMACLRMNKLEKAMVISQKMGKPQTTIVMTLVDFTSDAVRADPEAGKMSFAKSRKDVAGNLFKQQRYRYAYYRYDCAAKHFNDVMRLRTSEFRDEAEDLFFTCNLNMALCLLKMKAFSSCINACNIVLKARPNNVKGLFRRASAYHGLTEYGKALLDLKKAVELEPGNVEARKLLDTVKAAQKEEDKSSRAMYSNMCKNMSDTHSRNSDDGFPPSVPLNELPETVQKPTPELKTEVPDERAQNVNDTPEHAAAAPALSLPIHAGRRPPPCFQTMAAALFRICGRSSAAAGITPTPSGN